MAKKTKDVVTQYAALSAEARTKYRRPDCDCCPFCGKLLSGKNLRTDQYDNGENFMLQEACRTCRRSWICNFSLAQVLESEQLCDVCGLELQHGDNVLPDPDSHLDLVHERCYRHKGPEAEERPDSLLDLLEMLLEVTEDPVGEYRGGDAKRAWQEISAKVADLREQSDVGAADGE